MKFFLYISFFCIFLRLSTQEGVVINHSNINHYLSTKKVMLLNFYADWCRFSSALKPIYDKAADQVASETDQAALGKVDCEVEKYVCQQMYHITKYPTVKIVRNGQVMKKEYRGKRSVEALAEFIRKELRDPIEIVESTSELQQKTKDVSKTVVGLYPSNSSADYSVFAKVASTLKDDCRFFAVFDSNNEKASIAFKESNNNADENYSGNLGSVDELQPWLSEKCVPMVREITFENGEEMTEEGLPFLIMFYHPDHPETKTTFRQRVMEEVAQEKGSVNFVTADGVRFAHPLSHLGKSKKDLPLIAIDSFKHMYVFPNYEDINVPGKLKQFIDDLHSGKLHRDFHHKPAPAVHNPHHVEKRDGQEQPSAPSDKGQPSAKHANPSTPPESTFKKLQPARSRYTLLKHDEL